MTKLSVEQQKRQAAGRKAARTRKANQTAAAKTPVRRRRSQPKGFLAETFSRPRVEQTGKFMVSGFVGGGVASYINTKLLPDTTPVWQKIAITGGLAFLTGTVMKLPGMAAGMAGSLAPLALEPAPTMQENRKKEQMYLAANKLSQLPAMIDANGNALFLDENGGKMYLMEQNGETYQVDMDYMQENYDYLAQSR